ncbi:methyl-accepting chemotaxis protein [Shewanella algae]
MSLRHLTIGKKLAMAFSLFGAILLFMGMFSLYLFNQMNDAVIEITDANIPSMNIANDIRSQVTDFRRYELGYFLILDDPETAQQYNGVMIKQAQTLKKLFHEYSKNLFNQEETDAYTAIVKHWDDYHEFHNRVADLLDSGRIPEAQQLFLTQGPKKFALIVDDVEKLVNINHGFADTGKAEVEHHYDSATLSIIIITIAALLLVIFFATILTRQIRNPLTMLVTQARAISEGKLGRGELCDWIESGRINNDETGQLALAIREMKEGLKKLVTEISSSVEQLGSAVAEMSAISEQSAQGMSQQQNEIDQVATAMNEMQSTLQEVARNTTAAANAANNAMEAAHEGTGIVQQTVTSIDTVADKLDSASNVVQQLEQDSHNISMVLDVIRGIADQTNLLALNAAIEAARAGEQGRGFAVVSDEVRTLAQRTQTSTEEISKTIEMLQARTAEAGEAMQISRAQMQDSLELASKAGESIVSINEAVNTITDMSNQIASATEEQNVVAEDLNRNLSTIQMVSEENTQGTQHTAATCQDLNRLASDLMETTRRFDLGQ